MPSNNDDFLDRLIRYLAKREGIDKTLKIIRYTSKLIAATSKDSQLQQRFASLDSSLGVSRKALRLGKFLQDVNNARNSKSTGYVYYLELIAHGGEGLYYFVEQFVWLMKAGALSKTQEKKLTLLSAWAELFGYAASIWLSILKLQALLHKEKETWTQLEKLKKEEGITNNKLEVELWNTRYQRNLRAALILQDLADSTMAINDVRGGRDPVLSHPVTLALAGLTSAFISSYKNWNA